MNDTCHGCYGSGKFANGLGGANRCFRCKGSGLEPIDEVLYVEQMNRRVRGLRA